jgi:DNA-binding NarL/FixJ family response regulator
MIKIFLADDHSLIREGIKKIISTENDIKLVGETSDPLSILKEIEKLKPNVLVLDLSMPGKNGLDVLKEVKVFSPETNVLIMSMLPEDQFAKRTLKAGASGYITKDSLPDEILMAIRRVASGRKYVSQSLAEKLAADLDKHSEKNPHDILSDREFQILKLIASGKSQSEIADELQ